MFWPSISVVNCGYAFSCRLVDAPVVAVAPVLGQPLQVAHRHAAAPADAGQRRRASGSRASRSRRSSRSAWGMSMVKGRISLLFVHGSMTPEGGWVSFSPAQMADFENMLETSARLLRLLSLLQSRRDWSGAELAERLASARAPSAATRPAAQPRLPRARTPGVAGGYRLGAGAALPPLLLDDDEAVAVAMGLRTAAGGSSPGSRRPPCGPWPSWNRYCRPGCATGSTPCSR